MLTTVTIEDATLADRPCRLPDRTAVTPSEASRDPDHARYEQSRADLASLGSMCVKPVSSPSAATARTPSSVASAHAGPVMSCGKGPGTHDATAAFDLPCDVPTGRIAMCTSPPPDPIATGPEAAVAPAAPHTQPASPRGDAPRCAP